MWNGICFYFFLLIIGVACHPSAIKATANNSKDYDYIANRPYVLVLKDGEYSRNDDGSVKMSSTITYVYDGPDCEIIVDSGVPSDSRTVLRALASNEILPTDINFVISTNLRPDHTGNLNLFTYATYIVCSQSLINSIFKPVESIKLAPEDGGYEIQFLCPNVAVVRTKGHTADGNVVLVFNATDYKNVAITGDIFISADDIANEKIWRDISTDPADQMEARRSIIADADYIIPGHGRGFQVTDQMRRTVLTDSGFFKSNHTK